MLQFFCHFGKLHPLFYPIDNSRHSFCVFLAFSEPVSKLLPLLTFPDAGDRTSPPLCKIFVDKEAAFMYDNLNT
jgi:membrane-bound metal-dependent hydrolase YbcI (DUF457 family)